MISIVMPVLNRERFIGSSIRSVISQDYDDWELIVVDNGSTDKTLEIVEQYAAVDKRISVYVYDEKRGEYPATNYGISRAKGNIIGILHSDDMYPPNALSHVAERFSKDNELDVLCPRVVIIVDHGGVIKVQREFQTDLRFESLVMKMPMEPARFFRRRLYMRAGPIDESYRYAGFREWWIKISLRTDVKWVSSPQLCYIYRRHATQSSASLDRYGLLRYVHEHYRMFKGLMVSGLLTSEQKEIVKSRWLNDSISGFAMALRTTRFRNAFFCLTKGIELAPEWPLVLFYRKILKKTRFSKYRVRGKWAHI